MINESTQHTDNCLSAAKIDVRTCSWLVFPLLKIWNVSFGRRCCPLRIHS